MFSVYPHHTVPSDTVLTISLHVIHRAPMALIHGECCIATWNNTDVGLMSLAEAARSELEHASHHRKQTLNVGDCGHFREN